MSTAGTNKEEIEQPGLFQAFRSYVEANRQIQQQSACGWRNYIQNLYLSLNDKQ